MTQEEAQFVQAGIIKRDFVTDVEVLCQSGDYIIQYRHKLDGNWYTQRAISPSVLRQFQKQSLPPPAPAKPSAK